MFSIAMYFFGLVWTETCNFGSAILVGSGLIVFAYFTLVIYDPKSTPFDRHKTKIQLFHMGSEKQFND